MGLRARLAVEEALALGRARGLSRRELNRYLFCYAALLPTLALFFYIRLWPIAQSVRMSFFDWNILRRVQPFTGLKNYLQLVQDSLFQLALWNTTLFAVGTVIFSTTIALLLAVLLVSRIGFGSVYQLLLFVPVVTPWVPASVVWKWIYDPTYGPLNRLLGALGLPRVGWLVDTGLALGAILVVMIWKVIGYNMVILMVGLNNIPHEFYEAAAIDGAGAWQAFRFLTVPLLKPILLYVSVVTTINSYNVFTPVYVMTSDIQGAPAQMVRTLVYDMYENGFRYFKMGYASAEAVVLMLIVMALTLVQFRAFRER